MPDVCASFQIHWPFPDCRHLHPVSSASWNPISAPTLQLGWFHGGDQSAACPYSLLLFCRLRTMGAAFKDTETTNSFWEENHLSTLEFQKGKEDTQCSPGPDPSSWKKEECARLERPSLDVLCCASSKYCPWFQALQFVIYLPYLERKINKSNPKVLLYFNRLSVF